MNKEQIRERCLETEMVFSATRSSGPGGQNVNKVSSRIELRFNILRSSVLTDEEKALLSQKLRRKMNSDGELIITCQDERSQVRNREKAIEKFYDLFEKSLYRKPARIKTRPSAASREARIEFKKRRAVIKRGRIRPGNED